MDMHLLELILSNLIQVLIHILEIFGVIVIIYGATLAFFRFVRTRQEGREMRLTFAFYLVFGLEFKLAAEILHTVIARTTEELIVIGAIIILRAILNYIIHWEIRQETYEKELDA
ncbi:MAG: DUF1622 domain-containing protein [Bacillota bacterium]|nr:DUF1622 domain-containing protein [Bacillota bacterium]MDW7682747.1 DUF1622 domain-containing protein [Bacillota bacterium]